MKKTLFIWIAFCVVVLSACGGGGVTYITSKSPAGNTTVNINAAKAMAVEPWKVEMKVKAYGFKEGSLKFEIYAGELKQDENVKFNWQDENNCIISFTQSDDVVRNFKLVANENAVQMAEI